MICRRNQALSKFRQTKHNDDFLEFKRIRNQTQRKIQFAQEGLCPEPTRENQSYSKKLWCNLKQLNANKNKK